MNPLKSRLALGGTEHFASCSWLYTEDLVSAEDG